MKSSFLKIIGLLVAVVVLAACNDDKDGDGGKMRPDETIVEIAQGNDDLSILVAALVEAELVDALNGEGPFTVFAPTNDAFEMLLEQTGLTAEELLASEDLAAILTYHVVAGEFQSGDLTSGDVTTLNGQEVTVTVGASGVTLNTTSSVTAADILASNGVIHLIDEILVPEGIDLVMEVAPSIVDIAVANADFSILVQALTTADLVGTLSGDGLFTVFAPTDAAFAALLEELGVTAEQLLAREDLADILLYHVVSGKVLSTSLSNTSVGTLLDGAEININIDNGVMINGSNVTTADIEGINGVIHVIDEVLLPPTIFNVALRNGNFNTLVAALNTANLSGVLGGDGPFTVFAPTDDAFAALLEDLGITAADLLANPDLAEILTYHVVAGEVTSDMLSNGFVETVAGFDVEINIDNGVVLDGSVNVTTADLSTLNGVIHVVDKVLLPNTIADLVSRRSDFSTLAAALETAQLVSVLDGTDKYTVFAPNNAAFERLLGDLGITAADLLEDENLSSYLLYHVVAGSVGSADLPASAITAEGNSIYFSIGDKVNINATVQVTATDIKMKNGIIHLIDYVLLPPTENIVEKAIAAGFGELAAALTRVQNETETKVIDVLSGDGPYTVFAPTDGAFMALYSALGVADVDGIPISTLTNVLLYHVVSGVAFSTDLVDGLDVLILLTENALKVDLTALTVGGGALNADNLNILTTNGVIHVVNDVLLPVE